MFGAFGLPSTEGIELRAYIASERFDAGDKDGARAMIRETARKLVEDDGLSWHSTLAAFAKTQIKLGELDAAMKTIDMIKVEGQNLPLPPGMERPKGMDMVEKSMADSAKSSKALGLAELATAQASGNDKDNARKSLRAAIALLRDVSAYAFERRDVDAAVALAQARLGDIDAAIETLRASNALGMIHKTLDQILSDLSRNGDARTLELLSKYIPDTEDVRAAANPSSNLKTDLPKDKAARNGGVAAADPDEPAIVEPPTFDLKKAKIITFSLCLANNRLDSCVALAETRAGNLDAALAKIAHMNNQYMKAVTLNYVAEMVVERLKKKRE